MGIKAQMTILNTIQILYRCTLPQLTTPPCRIKSQRYLFFAGLHTINGKLSSVHTAADRNRTGKDCYCPLYNGECSEQKYYRFHSSYNQHISICLSRLSLFSFRKHIRYFLFNLFYILVHTQNTRYSCCYSICRA